MKEEREDDALPCFVELPGSGETNIKRENCNMIDSKLALVCDECGKEWKTKGHLKRHMQMVHQNVHFKCDGCDYKATDKRYVERHILFVHEKKITSYICTICSHQMNTVRALKSHNARKHMELSHACKSCEYKTADKSDLKKHISAVHDGVKYPCNLCQHKFSAKNSLRKHIVGIHTETKFECDQCSLKTNFQSNLIAHKRAMHKSPGNLRCDKLNFNTFNSIQEMEDKHEYPAHLNINLSKTRIFFIPKESKDPLI